MKGKQLWQSKTLWVNVFTAVVSIATFWGITPDKELSEQITSLLLVANPGINLLLRLVTKKPIVF